MTTPPPHRDQLPALLAGQGPRLRHRLGLLRDVPPALAPFQRTLQRSTLDDLEAASEHLRATGEALSLQHAELAAAQGAAARARRQYRDLFEFAPDPYLLTDARGVIRDANQAVSALIGYARSHALGKPLVSLVHPDGIAAFATRLKRLQERPPEEVKEFVTLMRARRTGSAVDVSVRVTAMWDEDGGVTGFLWSLRDVTEQQRHASALAEQERRHAQDLRTQTMELEAVLRMRDAEIAALRAEVERLRAPA